MVIQSDLSRLQGPELEALDEVRLSRIGHRPLMGEPLGIGRRRVDAGEVQDIGRGAERGPTKRLAKRLARGYYSLENSIFIHYYMAAFAVA